MSNEHLTIIVGLIIYTVVIKLILDFVKSRKGSVIKKDIATVRPKVMPAPQNNRYPMCKDQIAQIDCRVKDCNYNLGAGKCSNVSPAITLHDGGKFLCWSQEDKAKLGKTN